MCDTITEKEECNDKTDCFWERNSNALPWQDWKGNCYEKEAEKEDEEPRCLFISKENECNDRSGCFWGALSDDSSFCLEKEDESPIYPDCSYYYKYECNNGCSWVSNDLGGSCEKDTDFESKEIINLEFTTISNLLKFNEQLTLQIVLDEYNKDPTLNKYFNNDVLLNLDRESKDIFHATLKSIISIINDFNNLNKDYLGLIKSLESIKKIFETTTSVGAGFINPTISVGAESNNPTISVNLQSNNSLDIVKSRSKNSTDIVQMQSNNSTKNLSCAGLCGSSAEGGCFCDDTCHNFGDCCDDYDIQCVS